MALMAAGRLVLLPSQHAAIDSIAVLPFTNVSGDASKDYLSDGLTESLIGSLTHVPDLKVKSRNSVFRYKGKDVDAQKVGSELGVAALVSGRVTPYAATPSMSAPISPIPATTTSFGASTIAARALRSLRSRSRSRATLPRNCVPA